MANYDRPASGWRYKFGGINTRSVPDALPAEKYPIAINVRALADDSVITRPGYSFLFQIGQGCVASIITSIDPPFVAGGGTNFTLILTGINFKPTSVVTINGSARPTTFISSTELHATIFASDITC